LAVHLAQQDRLGEVAGTDRDGVGVGVSAVAAAAAAAPAVAAEQPTTRGHHHYGETNDAHLDGVLCPATSALLEHIDLQVVLRRHAAEAARPGCGGSG